MPVCEKCRTVEVTEGGDGLCPACRVTPVGSDPAAAAPAANPLALPKTPAPAGGTLKWWLLGAVGLVLFAVLLAESGAVGSGSADTQWTANGNHEAQWEVAGRGRAPLRGVTFSPTVVVSVTGSGRDLATEAAEAIKQAAPRGSAGGKTRLEIRITEVTPEGATWIPFHKTGSCTFTAEYTLQAETSFSVFAGRGRVTGKVTQTMTGFCSTGQFRAKMGEGIAKAIVSDIAKSLAKYS